jgi:hypothetical protein
MLLYVCNRMRLESRAERIVYPELGSSSSFYPLQGHLYTEVLYKPQLSPSHALSSHFLFT